MPFRLDKCQSPVLSLSCKRERQEKGKTMVNITEIGIRASALGLIHMGDEVIEFAGICGGAYCGEFQVYAGYRDFCWDCV